MKKLFTGIAIFATLVMPVFANAATVHMGENYSLAEDQIIEGNFYAAGAELMLLGDVRGDISAAGANVTLKGKVTEDVALVGGAVILDGIITGDVKLAGGDVTVSGTIGGDLLVGGGTVRIMSGASIGGDLLAAGGTVVFDGEVKGNMRLTGGDVMIIGTVGGSVWNYAERLTLSATAVVEGDFTNYSGTEPILTPGATIKGQIKNESAPAVNGLRGLVAASGVMGFLMFLVFGLICFWLFKNRSKQFVSHALAHFGKELLRGLILLIALPIFCIVLLVTIIGAPIGIVGLLIYIVMMMLARVFAGIMLGGWINKVIFKKPDQAFTWQTVIGGNVVLLLLGMLPGIGGIISFMFMLVAFGAFWGYLYRHFWANR